MARRLGADVPFFLIGGCVAATGTGTQLKALSDGPEKHS
jgi:4-diphosphocytidyl-2C-methyl-D-erythritol kinase